MKKFEKCSKHNLIDWMFILFWFIDLVLTIVEMAKGYSTMTPIERKISYIYTMIDLLWIFVISANLSIKNAITNLYDFLVLVTDIEIMKATTKKPEGLEEKDALEEEFEDGKMTKEEAEKMLELLQYLM